MSTRKQPSPLWVVSAAAEAAEAAKCPHRAAKLLMVYALASRWDGHDYRSFWGTKNSTLLVGKKLTTSTLRNLKRDNQLLVRLGLIERPPRFARARVHSSSWVLLRCVPPPNELRSPRERHEVDGQLWLLDENAVDNPDISTGGVVADSATTLVAESATTRTPVGVLQQASTDAPVDAQPATAVGAPQDACLPAAGESAEEDQPPTNDGGGMRLPGGEVNWREEIPAFLAALPPEKRPAPTNKVRMLIAEALDQDWDAAGLADHILANSGTGAGPGWTVQLLETVGPPWRNDAAINRVLDGPPPAPVAARTEPPAEPEHAREHAAAIREQLLRNEMAKSGRPETEQQARLRALRERADRSEDL